MPLLSAARSARLARILEGGETLRLQYPREDLGFVYDSPAAAVCSDQPSVEGDAATSARGSSTPNGQAPAAHGRAAPYEPTSVPGARLPHAVVTVRSAGERLTCVCKSKQPRMEANPAFHGSTTDFQCTVIGLMLKANKSCAS